MEFGRIDEVKKILNQGQDVNEVASAPMSGGEGASKTRVSPLSIAVTERNVPMIKLLMAYGANPLIKVTEGSPASLFGFVSSYYIKDNTFEQVFNILNPEGTTVEEMFFPRQPEKKDEFRREFLLGWIANLITRPSPEVLLELRSLLQRAPKFTSADKIDGRTLLELTNEEYDREYGRNPETFPRAEIIQILEQ